MEIIERNEKLSQDQMFDLRKFFSWNRKLFVS